MIRVDRSLGEAATLESVNRAHLTALETRAHAGTLKTEDFKSSIYSSKEVRGVLRQMQHEKCCYCERAYERSYSTVEHFRPKTTARDAFGHQELGYWWLAYEFKNLYFCCPNCNTFKSDRFPLGSGSRYTHPQLPWELESEDNLILDPGSTKRRPEDHLCFTRHPKHGCWRIAALDQYGEWTIRAANLDRDDLNELRDKYHRTTLEPIARAAPKDRTLARQIASKHCAAQSEFSLLARAVYQEVGLVDP